MHFQTALATLAALVSLAGADRLLVDVETKAWDFDNLELSRAYWEAFDGIKKARYSVDPRNGCQAPPHLPAMRQLCLDWHPDRLRGHFYFHGQGKRCISYKNNKASEFFPRHPCPVGKSCSTWEITEVPCTW